jgi:hypothetical protein
MIGVTVSPFGIWGSRDDILYADNRTATPNSTGALFQLDYTRWGTDISPLGPRFNVRIGMQYTVYTRFDGAGRNYDGLGHEPPTMIPSASSPGLNSSDVAVQKSGRSALGKPIHSPG